VSPVPQSRLPHCDNDCLVLHLVARSLDGRGAWSEFPVENWIVLSKADQQKLVPPGPAKVGSSWTIDGKVSGKVLTHFYPATENNDVSKNRLEEQALKGTVTSVTNGRGRARIDGALKMQHSFYHKEDGKVVEATVLGFLEYELATQRITSLQWVTEKATYGGGKFAVALRSLE
jgi:hypothetical protein